MNLNGNGNERQMPSEVIERLKWWAQLHSKTEAEAQTEYIHYLSDNLAVDDWQQEEDYFLIEAAENFVVERRVRGGGGGQTQEMVGCFVGVEKKVRDKRNYARSTAVAAAVENLDAAIQSGAVARAYTQDGYWMLEKANGVMQKTEETADSEPWFLVRQGHLTLAVLQNNSEWARYGEPIKPYLNTRTYYFVGNTQEAFEEDIKLWRIEVGNGAEQPMGVVQVGAPCRIKTRPQPENPREGWEDVLTGATNFFANVNYTNDFLDEEDRGLLAPERLFPMLDDFYVEDLSDLLEVYQTRATSVPGMDNAVGPLVIVKGTVTDINREGWDSEYDPTGKDYTMRISSFQLQRAHPDGLARELNCRVHGFLAQENNAFNVATEEGWKPYAVKSTVYLYGRLGLQTKETDNGVVELPRINVLGVYCVPRLHVPAGEGGNTDLGQFGGGQ